MDAVEQAAFAQGICRPIILIYIIVINITTHPTVVMVTAAHHTASNTPLGKNSGNSSAFER